jgi:hypothetical protein
MSDHTYKFQPGDVFVMKPGAHVKWVACSQSGGGITAARCDSPVGKKIMSWLQAGKPAMKHDAVVDMHTAIWKTAKEQKVGGEFWPHHLETAVKA